MTRFYKVCKPEAIKPCYLLFVSSKMQKNEIRQGGGEPSTLNWVWQELARVPDPF